VAGPLVQHEQEEKQMLEGLQQSLDQTKRYALPPTEQKIGDCLHGPSELVPVPMHPNAVPKFSITFGFSNDDIRPLNSISKPAWLCSPFDHSETSTVLTEEQMKAMLHMTDTTDYTQVDNNIEADTEMTEANKTSVQPPLLHFTTQVSGECSTDIIRSQALVPTESDKEDRYSTNPMFPRNDGPVLMMSPMAIDGTNLAHEVGFKCALPEDWKSDSEVVKREDVTTFPPSVKAQKEKPKFALPLVVPDTEQEKAEKVQVKKDKQLKKKKAPLLSIALTPNLATTLFQWHAWEGSSRLPANKNVSQIVFYDTAMTPPTILLSVDACAGPEIQSITTATVNTFKPENYPTGLATGFGAWFIVYIELPQSSRYPQGISKPMYMRLQCQQGRDEGNVTIGENSDEVVAHGPAWRVQHHHVFAFPEDTITGRKVVMHNLDSLPILVSEGEGMEMVKKRIAQMEQSVVGKMGIEQQFTIDVGVAGKVPCVDVVVHECDKNVVGKAWEGVLRAFHNGMLRIEGWKKVESLADL
jgi:hypothetical protein